MWVCAPCVYRAQQWPIESYKWCELSKRAPKKSFENVVDPCWISRKLSRQVYEPVLWKPVHFRWAHQRHESNYRERVAQQSVPLACHLLNTEKTHTHSSAMTFISRAGHTIMSDKVSCVKQRHLVRVRIFSSHFCPSRINESSQRRIQFKQLIWYGCWTQTQCGRRQCVYFSCRSGKAKSVIPLRKTVSALVYCWCGNCTRRELMHACAELDVMFFCPADINHLIWLLRS